MKYNYLVCASDKAGRLYKRAFRAGLKARGGQTMKFVASMMIFPIIISCMFVFGAVLLWQAGAYEISVLFGVCATYMSACGVCIVIEEVKFGED